MSPQQPSEITAMLHEMSLTMWERIKIVNPKRAGAQPLSPMARHNTNI